MAPVWKIANDRGSWLIGLGATIRFEDFVDGQWMLANAELRDYPRAKDGLITHIKVWQLGRDGTMRGRLIAVRSIISVANKRQSVA